MSNQVSFFLNGRAVSIENPSPDLLLIDYLRSPGVALAGPKKPCGQGGCGGCTVILSHWDEEKDKAEHRAINSCLRPVCALGGLVITTVEGTGAARKPDPKFLQHSLSASRAAAPIGANFSPVFAEAKHANAEKHRAVHEAVQHARATMDTATLGKVVAKVADHPSEHSHEGMNPVAHRLALNNGSQCGYCSVGFVMNMSEFIFNHPRATKKEIEDAFDGNLCRCTGYRAILTGMKTFASNWTREDEANRMKCLEDHVCAAQLPGHVSIPFPDEAHGRAVPVMADGNGQRWLTPVSLEELAQILHAHPDRKGVRLVHGNTSFGVYKEEFLEVKLFVDIRLIPELRAAGKMTADGLTVAAGTSYNDFIALLPENSGSTAFGALDFMARRTAGRIVRNAASLGGNTMLVLKHIAKGTGEPFASDLFTTLVAIEAKVTYLVLQDSGAFEKQFVTAGELAARVDNDAPLADRIVIVSYTLPKGHKNDAVLAQKVALREVNAHSIVNATTRFTFTEGLTVGTAALVFGGIAPYPWHATKTEKAMAGKPLTLASAGELSKILAKETGEELDRCIPRMKGLPDEGFTKEYRVQLAVSFLYKAIVNALMGKGADVPATVKTSGEVQWGNWPISDGRQYFTPQLFKAPVAQPYIKVSAMYQTSGQLHYTQELAVPPLTANGAFVQSRRALMNYRFVIPGSGANAVNASELRHYLKDYAPSFIDLITHANIKDGGVNLQGMGLDQPLFAVDLVSYVGQSIAMVLATTEEESIRIAEYVSAHCVAYSEPGAPWTGIWKEPIIDLFDAIKKGSIFPDAPIVAAYVSHIWKITRPGSQLDWVATKDPVERNILRRNAKVVSAPCVVVESSQLCGGQAHFYMERQACVAIPGDEGRIVVRPSTQSPMEMHQTIAMALNLPYHQVEVDVAPVGGAFGGKTEQARFVTGPTAVAAKATKRPVRVAVPRDEDTAMIGKRHAYYGQYQIAVDDGTTRAADRGVIHGLQLKLWGDGGAFYDCSFIVSNCVQLRTDNAYRIANFQSQIDVCRTNTAPSTAMRAFGDVQGKNILENAIDDAATALGMRPEELREKNLYDIGDVTPFGQALSYCCMKQVWQYVKDVSKFEEKRAAVEEYNRKNKWRKRGIAIIPVKYGSGYNFLQLEQSAALVVVNQADGTVVVHQSGVEMGQGLVTQVQQVAAYVLGLPMEMIFIADTDTSITPNPTSSGGSTGTPYSCEAVKQTCQQLRARLMEFGYELLKDNGNDWCKGQGIDFWNYGLDGSLSFAMGDLAELPALAAKLKNPRDKVSTFVMGQLSPGTRTALENYSGSTPAPALLQTGLIADLTKIIRGPLIWTKDRFKHVVLRRDTETRLGQNLTGDALVGLNRLLLEDAFPTELPNGRGWATTVEGPFGRKAMIWQFLIGIAFAKRVSLVASFTAKIKGGEVPVPAMTFKTEADQPNPPGIVRLKDATLGGGVDSFVGFTYSAACSVAEIDVLTGEVKILSSDIVYDMGWSMNPAIDIGQVEGAFVQGIGYLITEKLVFEPEGDHKGRLNTTNTWRYKIPAVSTIPLEMNTHLFPRDDKSVVSVPEDANEIFSAKEVGEPPLVLANSVFFAIKGAIRASRLERKLDPLFRFDAPATVQEVQRACEVTGKDLGQV
jgi:xanthine dehydrogenase/oxidase